MHRSLLICGLVLMVSAWLGCEGSPPPANDSPQARPTPVTEAETAETPPMRAETSPEDAGTAQEGAGGEKPPEPELPKYLKVMSLYDRGHSAEVDIRIEPGNRLILDTRNVQRIRIDRAELPLNPDRSIVLRLDGQGIEWRADSEVSVFERSPNGYWAPVKPTDARRRR